MDVWRYLYLEPRTFDSKWVWKQNKTKQDFEKNYWILFLVSPVQKGSSKYSRWCFAQWSSLLMYFGDGRGPWVNLWRKVLSHFGWPCPIPAFSGPSWCPLAISKALRGTHPSLPAPEVTHTQKLCLPVLCTPSKKSAFSVSCQLRLDSDELIPSRVGMTDCWLS